MEPESLGRATRRKGKARTPGGLDTSGTVQAPTASVLAPADLERELATQAAADPRTSSKAAEMGFHIFLWVFLYTVYFGTNGGVLMEMRPWSVSIIQQFIGCVLVVVLWVLKRRPVPGLTLANVKTIAPIAVCHTFSHICFAIGVEGAFLSFEDFFVAEVLFMATRPLFTALFSAIFLKQTFSRWVYTVLGLVLAGTTMIIVDLPGPIGDVMGSAIGFNLVASIRTVLAKRLMVIGVGDSMSPVNLYAVVTIMSSAMFLPLWIIVEGYEFEGLWNTLPPTQRVDGEVLAVLFISGICFHFFNEVSFRCLDRVQPLTQTVGSTCRCDGCSKKHTAVGILATTPTPGCSCVRSVQ
eukprot:g16070.t1